MRRLIRSLPGRSGVLCVATCDKGLPASMIAIAGCSDLPSIIVPGGVTLPTVSGEDTAKVQTMSGTVREQTVKCRSKKPPQRVVSTAQSGRWLSVLGDSRYQSSRR